MRNPTVAAWLTLSVLVIPILLLDAAPLFASNSEDVEISRQIEPGQISVVVFEVPPHRRLVVTDLITTGGFCGHRLGRSGTPLLFLCVPGGNNRGDGSDLFAYLWHRNRF